MAFSIDDPEICRLAETLARLRGIDTEEAIALALREELKREREKRPLTERLRQIADETVAMGKPGGHVTTKDEIDDLWGQ